jgi:hypothetical protein
VTERGGNFRLSQFGGGYDTPGFTRTREFRIVPGSIVAHVGLARVSGGEAAIGISEYDDESGPHVFANEALWDTAMYAKTGHFVVSAYVARGVMRGWWYFQVWR